MDFSEFFGCEWMDFGGGRYRGGIFGRGDLKFMVLRVLAERPMHGYDVMRALESESRGCYRASPGSIYPTLQMLEDEGYLSAAKEGGKKVYTVTPEGHAFLGENEERVEKIYERIHDATDRFFGQDMENLMSAFSKLAEETFEGAFRWTEDTDFMGHVREILDSASDRIEEARKAAREARTAARDAARDAARGAREAAAEARDAAMEAAREARGAAANAYDAARESARDMRDAARDASEAAWETAKDAAGRAERATTPSGDREGVEEGNPASQPDD